MNHLFIVRSLTFCPLNSRNFDMSRGGLIFGVNVKLYMNSRISLLYVLSAMRKYYVLT